MSYRKIGIAMFVFFCVSACENSENKKKEASSRHLAAAKTYLNQAHYRSVIIEARNVLKTSPENVEAIKLIAQAYNEMGAFRQTATLLQKHVASHPELKFMLAKAYMGSRKFNSAAETLKGIDSLPLDENAYEVLIQVNQAQKLQDEVNRWVSSFKAKFPNSPSMQLALASQAAYSGQLDEAKRIAEAVLTQSPSSINALILLANIAASEKKLPLAEEYLLKAQAALPNADVFTVNKLMVFSQLAEVVRMQDRISEYYAYQKVISEANPEADIAQQKYNQAAEFFKKGQLTEAASLLNELIEQNPQDKNSATLLAIIQSQKGSHTEAVKLFDKVIDPETASPLVLQAAAAAKIQVKNAEGALDLLKQAAEKQPKNAEILATYAVALLEKNPKDASAAKLIEKSLALSPQLVKLRLILAKHYSLTGQPELALAQLDKAFVDKPDDLLVQKNYFSALLQEKQLPKLKQIIESLDANNKVRAQFWRGWLELEQRNFAVAEKIFIASKDEASGVEKTLLLSGLAQVKESQNDVAAAIAAWLKVIQVDPSSETGYSRLLQIAIQHQKYDDVIKAIKTLAADTKTWQPLAVLAQITFEYKQDFATALQFAESALAASDNAASVKQLMAKIYTAQSQLLRQSGKHEEAKPLLLKATALTPENLDLQVTLVEIELANKNIAEAKKLVEQYTKAGMNPSAAAYLGGIISVAEGKVDESIHLFLESWRLTPTLKSAESIFGYYTLKKLPNDAVKFLDEWIEKLPNNAAPYISKALFFQQQNKVADAINLYEKALTLAPNAVLPLNNLAWLYFEKNDSKALPLAKKAAELASESPDVLDTYGWILFKNGNVSEAKSILEKAAKLAPNNKEILEHLEALKK